MNKAEKYFNEHPNKDYTLDACWTEEARAKVIIEMLTDFAKKEAIEFLKWCDDNVNYQEIQAYYKTNGKHDYNGLYQKFKKDKHLNQKDDEQS